MGFNSAFKGLISTLILSFHNHHISSNWYLPFRCSKSKSECFYHPSHALLHDPPVASSPLSPFLYYPYFTFALFYIFRTSTSTMFMYCSHTHTLCLTAQGIDTAECSCNAVTHTYCVLLHREWTLQNVRVLQSHTHTVSYCTGNRHCRMFVYFAQ